MDTRYKCGADVKNIDNWPQTLEAVLARTG